MINKLKDQSGASIVIGLLFFLICIAVGGVVVTAASVGANAVNKEKQTEQAQYDVGCAASAIGDQLSSSVVSVNSSVDNGVKSFVITQVEGTDFAREFWTKQGSSILANYGQNMSSTFNDVAINGSGSSVTGTMSVDANLNITVSLGLADSKSYAMTVFLQAVPTYDFGGRLVKVEYEQPVIQKTSDTKTNGGA